MPPPLTEAETEARIAGHLDELLALWHAEQGPNKNADLELMAASLPFAPDHRLKVLDLCCGPGDVGRAIRASYPAAAIDCVDRDRFLTAICRGINRRDRVPGTVLVRDLWRDDWSEGLAGGYDVVAIVNALHWFDAARAGQVLAQVRSLLGSGGVLVFAEPTSAASRYRGGFDAWRAQQAARYTSEAWRAFWSRANELLGYDHTAFLGPRRPDRIDDSLTALGWIELVRAAGFVEEDVLWRDGDQVVVAAVRPDG